MALLMVSEFKDKTDEEIIKRMEEFSPDASAGRQILQAIL